MIGKVIDVNRHRGLVIFEDVFGDYGYFEVLGGEEFESGETISGELHSLGSETITNQNKKEKVNVFIEDFGMSLKKATGIVFK